MPVFDDALTADAPIEEVWKLLYDPGRMAEWMDGIETVAPEGHDGRGDLTFFFEGYPDDPLPQQVRSSRDGRTVLISCLSFALEFAWRLDPAGEEEDHTRIAVHVDIPDAEAARVDQQRAAIGASLRTLAQLAEREAAVS